MSHVPRCAMCVGQGCPYCDPRPTYVPIGYPYPATAPAYFTPLSQISDSDVERIARRVAELLKGQK